MTGIGRVCCVVALALAGCTDTAFVDGGGVAVPPTPPEPTEIPFPDDVVAGEVAVWFGDLQQRLAEGCGGCHRKDGFATPDLSGYIGARNHADAVIDVIEGEHGGRLSLANATCRDDAGIYTLALADRVRAWQASGYPAGDSGGTPHPDPVTGRRIALGAPQVSLTADAGYTPAAGETRCFPLEPFPATRWLRAVDVRPERDAAVARVTMHAVPPALAGRLQALDAADGGLGYACAAGVAIPERLVHAWSPGDVPFIWPAGTAVGVPGGWPLIVRVTYTEAAAAAPAATALDLWTLAEAPEHALVHDRIRVPDNLDSFTAANVVSHLAPGVHGAAVIGPLDALTVVDRDSGDEAACVLRHRVRAPGWPLQRRSPDGLATLGPERQLRLFCGPEDGPCGADVLLSLPESHVAATECAAPGCAAQCADQGVACLLACAADDGRRCGQCAWREQVVCRAATCSDQVADALATCADVCSRDTAPTRCALTTCPDALGALDACPPAPACDDGLTFCGLTAAP